MKKRTIIVSIMSILMLVTISWIIPANVQAYKTEGNRILEEIKNYSKNLSEDADFQQLINLHSSQEMEDIFKQVLTADNENEIHDLADQYVDLINVEDLNQISHKLNNKYTNRFNILKLDIYNLYNSNSDDYDQNSEEFYYKITEDENGLIIDKIENEDTSEDTILIRGSDGAIKISDGDWITQDALDNLKEFLNYLAVGGIIASYFGIYLGMWGLALAEIGFERIGYLLFRFGFRVGFICLFTSIYAQVFLMIIDVFEKLLENEDDNISKQKNCMRVTSIFHLIFEKIMKFLQNINADFNLVK